jgi:predicted Fe-Mo cluster-binding NifX family protein
MLLKIAIPIVAGRLSGHFGETKFFAVVEADQETRAIVRTQTIAAPPHEPGSIPRWLREQGVQILIAGGNGIGPRALDYLVHHGIEVLVGKPDATLETLVGACLEGRLPRLSEGCNGRHSPVAKADACRLSAYFERQTDGD